LCLVFDGVAFSSDSEAFRQGEQLIKSTCTREHERGGVEYNVVGHAVRIGIGDETVIRPIVGEGRSKIKSDETEVVPSFSASVVQNNERPARGDRVGEKVVRFAIDSIVGGDRVKIGVSAHQING
jgi:hypothetical protein